MPGKFDLFWTTMELCDWRDEWNDDKVLRPVIRHLSKQDDQIIFAFDDLMAELAAQLEDLYIVDFDGASEDYHFTIMNKGDCEKAMDLFSKMTAHIEGYTFKSFVITDDFQG